MTDPATVCLLRLSALGDVSHLLPLVHAFSAQQPETRLTWVLGHGEAQLLDGLEHVELLPYRKRDGMAGMRALWKHTRGRRFDALLLMQLALRANLLALGLSARRRIGYDRARSKEGHSLFIDERIAEHPRGHVLETLCRFGEPLGVRVDDLVWKLPIPDAAHAFARSLLPSLDVPLLGISACSSHALRNWNARGYAELARHAYRRHGMEIVLLGGRSKLETDMRDAIVALAPEVRFIDIVGKDTLKQMLALLSRLSVLVTPDAGPAHLASALGVPVLGLYAATDANRSGPYRSIDWCINHYPASARRHLKREPAEVPWGKRIEYPGVMEQITIEETVAMLDRLLATPVERRLAPARLRRPNETIHR
jgi:heptosyltransferase I